MPWWYHHLACTLYVFHAVDVLLAGGLLAGGSDSVHKLMQIYTTFMDVSQEKARERA